jgi:peptidoglycan glycosyltransferase
MIQVVQRGSGFYAQIPGVTVAGKTGTAETGTGQQPHAWFICFAPADHPRVAAVVIVEHGGEGATTAAPIAKQILQAALPLVSH